MASQTLKEAKKWADMLRKCGISSYKCPEFEINLSSNYNRPTRKGSDSVEPVQTDKPNDNKVLFWSSDIIPDDLGEQ